VLYIITKSPHQDDPREFGWHTGKRLPIYHGDIQDVTEIQADGDELRVVLELFGTSIPRTNKKVQRWFGDIAKTIAAALGA
jgi:hypothetical protein